MQAGLILRRLLSISAAALVTSAPLSQAAACGGFFCSQTQPVNQAAERIVFADNGDGSVTAVIQIMYQGPSENFSWLLPISSVPQGDQIDVASNIAFQRLQIATNPQYNLSVRVEGECSDGNVFPGFVSDAAGSPRGGGSPVSSTGGVTVEASGIVGAFEWTVISVDQSLPDLADVAVNWLEDNGYDVADGARGLLRPYLMDGLYLLALKLTKGSDSGSIRPIVLTYAASQPMIPIKLTAVAANENMGVMTWLLQDSRGVPQNYLSLELNEARIDWFNAARNYNAVVTAAADEAMGQGFVTEFAGQSARLADVVWRPADEAAWNAFYPEAFQTPQAMLDRAVGSWGGWDGFWDVVRQTVTLADGVTIDDLRLCSSCYASSLALDPATFAAAIDAQVLQPVRDMQALIDRNSYVTRLYTTMSAAEMTVDPVFTFNPDLADVDNVHTAVRVIECGPALTLATAPWRIELPQGGVIRGAGTPAPNQPWPELGDQPANRRITRQSGSGSGAVVEDNASRIQSALDGYNSPAGSAGASGTSGAGGMAPGASGRGSSSAGATGNSATPASDDGGSCALAPRRGASSAGIFAALAALALVTRRRRG